MPLRIGPGPVFVSESIAAARRWQVYALRAFFVLGLLAGLAVVWASLDAGTRAAIGRGSFRELASVGESFYLAIATVQVAVVLLVAPAATAGAVCLDRARGSLTHVLVTDLSDTEIVFGKLAARLAPVLALVLSGLPVLGLASLLGGIIPESVILLAVVSLATATLGCALALAISVRAKKSHEVLMAVYAIWAVWVFGLAVWWMFASVAFVANPPDWYSKLNPFLVAWAPYSYPSWLELTDVAIFLATTLSASALLAVYSVWKLRAEVRGTKQPIVSARTRLTLAQRLSALRPAPKLDANPVLWREWHRNRPGRLARAVWALYYLGAAAGTVFAFVYVLQDYAQGAELLLIFTVLHITFGLLLVSLTAPTALAEERVRGGLDVLLTTPISTVSVVWAKWRAAFWKVPGLVVLPCFASLLLAVTFSDDRLIGSPRVPFVAVNAVDRVGAAVFPIVLLLAQGAAVTSLGLALAVWIPRVGRALAVSVMLYLAFSIGILFASQFEVVPWVLETCGVADPRPAVNQVVVSVNAATGQPTGPPTGYRRPTVVSCVEVGMLSLSPGGGQASPIIALVNPAPADLSRNTFWAVEGVVLGIILAFAGVMYGLTLLTFNRCLGRVPERVRKPQAEPVRPHMKAPQAHGEPLRACSA